MALDLVARLKLDDQFSSPARRMTSHMSRMQSVTERTSGSVKRFGASVAGLSTAIGLTAALSGSFNLVKNSIDGAMKRIDTFESFERVLTTLTGSAEQTKAALEATRESVTGTAYGLDTAAKSVQDFVTRGMDINKATKTMTAFGDAVAFYGNGSNEQLAGVSDALAKMYSSGKVGMDQMNRLYDAGIDGVGMYAKAVGRDVGVVQKELSAGKITASDFIETLTTAMMEGTGGVTKIAGAAKEAGASWGSTFGNMRAAVARGVEGIILKTDDLLASNGLPEMREMVAQFGKGFENALNKVANHLPLAAEKLEQLYKALLPLRDEWPKIKDGLIAAAAAFVTFKAAMAGYAVIQTVTGLLAAYRAGTLAATLAQKGLNVAMLTNPFTWIAVGIAAAVAAGVLLYRNWDAVKAKAGKLWAQLIDLKDNAVGKLADKFTALKDGIIDLKDNAVQKISDKFQEFTDFLKENETAIKTTAAVLASVFGPALIKVGVQAAITASIIAGQFIASLIKTGAQAAVTGAIVAGQFVASLIKTAAQAAVTGAVMSASLIASFVRLAAQAVVTGAVMTGQFVASLVRTSAQAIATAAVLTGSMIAAMIRFAVQGWATVASIAATTAAFVAQRVAMAAGAVVLGAMTAAQWALNAAMTANPIGLVIAAIVALIAVGVLLYQNWDTVKAKVIEVWDTVKTKISDAMSTASSAVSNFFSPLLTFLDNAKAKWDGFIGAIKNFKMPSISLPSFMGGGPAKSHYHGLDRVPYDGYMARLHKGETVLTRQESDAYAGIDYKPASYGNSYDNRKFEYSTVSQTENNGGKGGIYIAKLADEIVVREEADVDRIANEMVKKIIAATGAGA